MEELYKKGLNDLDNHDGVITYLEPDILECQVKWVLGSITTNKASGGDGILAERSKVLKDDAVKVQYASKFGKLSSGHRTRKCQFLFQFSRKTMPKNVQTTVQFCSFHMLARLCSKSFKLSFSSTGTENLQMFKLDLFREGRGTRDQIANIR